MLFTSVEWMDARSGNHVKQQVHAGTAHLSACLLAHNLQTTAAAAGLFGKYVQEILKCCAARKHSDVRLLLYLTPHSIQYTCNEWQINYNLIYNNCLGNTARMARSQNRNSFTLFSQFCLPLRHDTAFLECYCHRSNRSENVFTSGNDIDSR